MHPIAWKWVAQHLPEMPGRVVEIGGRDVSGGGLQSLLVYRESYISVDIADGPGVDVVSDFSEWAFAQPRETVDTVISCEVFEHTPTWPGMVAAAAHLLVPGGLFVMTCATHPRAPHSAIGEPVVPDGEWYQNVPASMVAGAVATFFTSFTLDLPGNGDLRAAAHK